MPSRGLSAKRRVFVEEYLRCWNASEAARRAEYAHPYAQGPRLLDNVEIQALIQERLREKAMSADEVMTRLAEQARAEQSAYRLPDGRVDLDRLLAEGKGHLVKNTRWDRRGNLVVEFHDAQAALALIGKHHKQFTDNVEIRGGVEASLEIVMGWRDEIDTAVTGLAREPEGSVG